MRSLDFILPLWWPPKTTTDLFILYGADWGDVAGAEGQHPHQLLHRRHWKALRVRQELITQPPFFPHWTFLYLQGFPSSARLPTVKPQDFYDFKSPFCHLVRLSYCLALPALSFARLSLFFSRLFSWPFSFTSPFLLYPPCFQLCLSISYSSFSHLS